jgi:hypothetical protein
MMIQSRAERDAGHRPPAGCRRRAASTSTPFITTLCGGAGWQHPGTGDGHRRMNGSMGSRPCEYAMCGNEATAPPSKRSFARTASMPKASLWARG